MKHTVYEVKLNNGARGLLINIADASVMTAEFNFRAGEYLVERPKWETPHLMEHLLLGANKSYPKARTFQAEFEKNGAYSNASTGAYDITYEAECADFEWDRILKLLIEAISRPLFLEEEFIAEAGNVREELTARSNNHFRHLSLALRQKYGYFVMTDKERLGLMDNVTIKDIRQHYKNTHSTSNLRFVVAGSLPPERRRAVRSIISNLELPSGEGRIDLPPELPIKLPDPLYIHNPTVDNLYFYIDTFISRRLRDPEVDALGLINTMLTETLYSRILGTAREKGLVYHVSSGFNQANTSADWWFGAQVMPKNATALFDIIIRELRAVFNGRLKEEDVVAAKQYALGRYQRSGQTVSGTAAGYSYRYFFDDQIDDYYKMPERIRAVSRNRITTITKELFSEDIWGFGVLGQAKQPLLKKLYDKLNVLWPKEEE